MAIFFLILFWEIYIGCYMRKWVNWLMVCFVANFGNATHQDYVVAGISSCWYYLGMRPSFSAGFIETLPWYSYLIGGVVPGANVTIDNSFLLIQGALGVPFSSSINLEDILLFSNVFSIYYWMFVLLLFPSGFFVFQINLIQTWNNFGLIFWVMVFHKSKSQEK